MVSLGFSPHPLFGAAPPPNVAFLVVEDEPAASRFERRVRKAFYISAYTNGKVDWKGLYLLDPSHYVRLYSVVHTLSMDWETTWSRQNFGDRRRRVTLMTLIFRVHLLHLYTKTDHVNV